jgi:uncharacterized Fe-S cluster-containing radical SAM superfamily protein
MGITQIPVNYLRPDPPAPKSVKIEISPRCNYRCGFCALRTRAVQPKQDMDFGLFKRITAEMREAGVEEIGVFYLGESFMDPALLQNCIGWLKLGLDIPYVFLTSNASLATPHAVDRCMLAGLDSLKWSVNAADEDQFKRVMGVSGKNFHLALENIRTAWGVRRAEGYKTGLYASSIEYDGEQRKRMAPLLEKYVLPYVDQHYWLPVYGQMTHWNKERTRNLGFTATAGNQGRIGALRDPLPCWSAFTEGHVTADGLLSMCCFDSDGRFAMGDLRKQSFMEAWNSQQFVDMRRTHLAKNVSGTICEGCLAYAKSARSWKHL